MSGKWEVRDASHYSSIIRLSHSLSKSDNNGCTVELSVFKLSNCMHIYAEIIRTDLIIWSTLLKILRSNCRSVVKSASSLNQSHPR